MRIKIIKKAYQYWHQNRSSGISTLFFSTVLKHWKAGYAYPRTNLKLFPIIDQIQKIWMKRVKLHKEKGGNRENKEKKRN